MTKAERMMLSTAARAALEVIDNFDVPAFSSGRYGTVVTVARRATGLVWRCRRCSTAGALYGETLRLTASDILSRFLERHLYGGCLPC